MKQLIIGGVAALVVVVALAAVVVKPWQSRYPRTWDDRVSAIAVDVEAKRGLEFKHPVAVHFMSDAAFERTLEAGDVPAADQAGIDQGAAELRALGLVGSGVDVFARVQRRPAVGRPRVLRPADRSHLRAR